MYAWQPPDCILNHLYDADVYHFALISQHGRGISILKRIPKASNYSFSESASFGVKPPRAMTYDIEPLFAYTTSTSPYHI